MNRLIFAIIATAFIVLSAASTMAGAKTSLNAGLSVKISKIKNDKGKLVVALFDSKENFLKKTLSELSLDIGEGGEVLAQFYDIPPGIYAIAAYHDKNADGKLNTFMLVPREDYGFSNDARSMFGPPSFKSASFEVGEQDMGIDFRVR
ncbi:MAG: DUF2141 domain-containing protein [Gammaproteobacteria bacterium]|nr:DUF2141 domain-containing protein [Gammaproteobacteria bacterium]